MKLSELRQMIRDEIAGVINEAENRIVRKPGQHRDSSKHSDLYTDENTSSYSDGTTCKSCW